MLDRTPVEALDAAIEALAKLPEGQNSVNFNDFISCSYEELSDESKKIVDESERNSKE